MFNFDEFQIHFLTGSQAIVWIFLIAFIGLSIYLYRKTNPPLPLYLKIILGGLRILAVLALFTALLEPVISYTKNIERSKKVTVLLDYSSSMNKIEQGKSRKARLDSLLSLPRYESIQSEVDFRVKYFGGNVSEKSNEVIPSQTAIGDLLSSLQTEQLTNPDDYWLLFSDGNSNSGKDPKDIARTVQTPVIAVNVADDVGYYDIGISEVEFNPVIFTGEKSEIKVHINWQDADGKTLKVELVDSGKVVDNYNFKIDQESGLGEITLNYIPKSPGQKILNVKILFDEKEENPGNNSQSISLKVLKSKMKVLLITSAPDYETGFLKRFFDQTNKYDAELIVTAPSAGNLTSRIPTKQTELNRYDLVILQDMPSPELSKLRTVLKSYLADKGGALWLMMGEKFSQQNTPDWLTDILPFYPTKRGQYRYREFQAIPAEGQLFHPSVRLGDDQVAIRNNWADLPPFQSFVDCDETNPQAVILAYSDNSSDNRSPIFGYRRIGPGKVFVSAALPIWTWGFVDLGFGGDGSNFRTFLEGTSSWLTVKDDFDPIRITPEKQIYNRGETVRFNGFAYDLGFREIPGVLGAVKLVPVNGDLEREIDLISIGEGRYKAEFDNLAPGEYKFNGYFEKNGEYLKETEGKILIESFSLEQFDQRSDPATLTAIARLSGGDYFNFKEIDDALDMIDVSAQKIVKRGEIIIWNKLWLLIIIIASLSLEWLIRKSNQLI